MITRLPTAIIVESKKELKLLIAELKGQPFFAIDFERTGFHSYFSDTLCLAQICFDKKQYIVDMVTIGQNSYDVFQDFFDVLEDQNICKVMHGSGDDIASLKRMYDVYLRNLFDTSIADAIIQNTVNHHSLVRVLKENLNIILPKQRKLQRANWSRRPLTKELINYAQYDVHFLCELKRVLEEKLMERKLSRKFKNECLKFEEISVKNNVFDPNDYLRTKNSQSIPSKLHKKLRKAYVFREYKAVKLDKPPRMMLPDPVLISLVLSKNQSINHLIRAGLSRNFARKWGKELLEALNEPYDEEKALEVIYNSYPESILSKNNKDKRDYLNF
ncbi:MAG: HRDC domain-containing protein [Candidatus Kariarchaeaceae archaeon]